MWTHYIRIPGPSKQVIINGSQMASRKFHPVSRVKSYCLKSWRYYKHTHTCTHTYMHKHESQHHSSLAAYVKDLSKVQRHKVQKSEMSAMLIQ